MSRPSKLTLLQTREAQQLLRRRQALLGELAAHSYKTIAERFGVSRFIVARLDHAMHGVLHIGERDIAESASILGAPSTPASGSEPCPETNPDETRSSAA